MIINVEELSAYITEKLADEYTYETYPEAIAEITLAAFNFAAGQLSASGWAASHAELLFMAKSRGIDGPFAVVSARDMLYPQYSDRIPAIYRKKWLPWAKEEAQKMLDAQDTALYPAAASVYKHWKDLVDE